MSNYSVVIAQLLERLDQAISEVIDTPKSTKMTAAIGTLPWQTLYVEKWDCFYWMVSFYPLA